MNDAEELDGIRSNVFHEHGARLNQQGGPYIRGRSYCYLKKIEVAAAYLEAKAANDGLRPNISELQRTCRVSRKFVNKIEAELDEHGRVLQ